MKNIYLSALVLLGLLTGCYADKGGNDFDSPLADVEMTIPGTAYSAALGSSIEIEPEVNTTISDDDLEYIWEAYGNGRNSYGRTAYTPIENNNGTSRKLSFTCHLDTTITALNTSYTCRLHARQKSTGRDFYSTNTFTITIAGVTGLLVLHGDDSSSDIGIVEANEFMPSSSSLPGSPSATPAIYSSSNSGQKLSGKGKSIVNAIPSYTLSSHSDHYDIVAQTSDGIYFANTNDFSYKGDWSSMFYLTGDEAVNHNKPQGFVAYGSYFVGFDDSEMFMCDPNNSYPFLTADYTDSKICADGNSFGFDPFVCKVASSGGIQALGYCNKVNGQTQKGFVGFSQLIPSNCLNYTNLLDTKSDNVLFNPGNMHASLITMYTDARQHVLAVLKGDADHPQLAGKYFAVDLYPHAETAGETGRANIPCYLYDMSSQSDIDNAFAFAFGSTKNMCYYATPSGVYHYGVDESTLYSASALGMTNGSALSLNGEVTMMKLLDSPNVETHNTEPILVVATWQNNEATLYALHIDESTGNVKTAVKYNKDNVEGWNFGIIRDVNIKGV